MDEIIENLKIDLAWAEGEWREYGDSGMWRTVKRIRQELAEAESAR